jgi:CheY-like chemotaxis protein
MLSKPRKILLVEDHHDSAEALARLLQSYGHSVMVADCCKAARDDYRSNSFDVLLLDIGLPDCDGCDLLHELRTIRKVPAIAITGYAMPRETQRCKDAGFVACITKPFDLPQLKQALSQIKIAG